ncbi:MAG: 16S rRNA (guanine(527)-N(7))-methyltransferase RsmG [Gammaproteobacteria bacterium]|nr:16S rRNA (guanine(527)-N(7))-methyltransferase RsmG [Gammaproteobacteria bacterium]
MNDDLVLLSSLKNGMLDLGMSRDVDGLAHACLRYLQLLEQWNRAYNLTAVRSLPDMVSRHILDSLAILPWVKGQRILDVGTGAGLPGIPLALACPDKQWVLLDSNGKKTRFLLEVQRVLGLSQIEIIQDRVEAYEPAQAFDSIVSRAFSEVQKMLDQTQHLLVPQGQWMAMKGPQVVAELPALQHPYRVESYRVPGEPGERYCVIIEL